jgi:predicted RNA binding protein YcfA (HicA-like mRNA interferase family)
VSDKAKEVAAALDAGGFKLVRKKKHKVFRNPEGKTLVTSATPSDVNAAGNQLRDLRRLLLTDAPAEVSEASDAELPKRAKKRAGAAKGSAHVHNWYKGDAPPSVRVSQQTITMLRELRKTNAYKFKSKFLKQMAADYNQGERERIEFHEASIRDFAVMWPVVENADRTGIPFDARSLPYEQGGPWRVLSNNLMFVLEQMHKRGESFRNDKVNKLTLAQLQLEIRESYKHELPKRAALMNLFGRVANHLLRGESAAEIREFIAPRIAAIEDKFSFDFKFDFAELIEEIAAEKVETL